LNSRKDYVTASKADVGSKKQHVEPSIYYTPWTGLVET
jgi:hypothetical protein